LTLSKPGFEPLMTTPAGVPKKKLSNPLTPSTAEASSDDSYAFDVCDSDTVKKISLARQISNIS